MKRICAALLVVFAVLGWARAQSAEEQLKKMEMDRAQAVIKGDVDAVGKQTSEDYTLINVNGQMSGKAQTLDAIKSGQIKITQNELSDMKVHVYGNTAVVTGKADVKGTMGGRDVSGPVAFTRVWVKKGGKWESVAFQQTKLQ